MQARIVQWREREVSIRIVPMEGLPDGEPENECEPAHALVFAGHGRTGGGGSWRIDLSAIVCPSPGPAHNGRPSVVATPTSGDQTDDVPRPVILMARIHGLQITIWSLAPNGAPVGHVEFSWHCVVEGEWVD